MNGGKKLLRNSGYTIIEVMVVLGVSGMTFFLAAGFINGKQQRTAFTTNVGEFAAQIQATINEVNDGKYSDVPLNCNISQADRTTAELPNVTPLKTDGRCLYLGKVLHFGSLGSTVQPNADPEASYDIFSVVGRRYDDGTIPASMNRTAANGGVVPGVASPLTRAKTIPGNLHLVKPVTFSNNASNKTYMIGFMPLLQADNFGAVLKTGAHAIVLYYIANSTTKQTAEVAANNVIKGNIFFATQATLCVSDGTRYAVLAIGGNAADTDTDGGGVLTVTTKMLGGVPCA